VKLGLSSFFSWEVASVKATNESAPYFNQNSSLPFNKGRNKKSATAQQLHLQVLSIDMHLGRYILYLSRVLNFQCGVIKFYMIFEAGRQQQQRRGRKEKLFNSNDLYRVMKLNCCCHCPEL
jgi:hypothetical protein